MSLSPAQLDLADAHAHFFSHSFFKALLALRPGAGEPTDDEVTRAVAALAIEAPPRDPLDLARRWVQELDRHGVSRTVLIASVPGDWPSVAAAVKAFPQRFTGFAMANPLGPNAAASLEQALDDGGLRGVCLFPAMHRFHVYDPPARTLIEVARRRRAVVFCHFGVLKVPVRERFGLRDDFDGTYSVPTDLHRVAADYPDVQFIVPHFGCGYFRELLLLGAQRPNVCADTSSSNSWLRLLPYPLDLETVVRKTLDIFGPERVLWGSDSSVFPRGWRRDLFDLQLDLFQKAGLSDAQLRAVFGGNLRRLVAAD
jgi:hypothetical protein